MSELDPIGVSVPDGLDWSNEYGQSISQTELEKRIPVSVRSQEIFAKADFRAFSDEFLILNDIVLPDVATSDVVIESNNNVFVAETLRSQSPIVTSSGIHDWTVTVTLNFQPGPSQTNKLHRLVSQISKHPLVFVYNGRIRRSLNITDPSVTTMFIVESGTLRNSPHTIGDIVLDLTLHYFNYKPFSNHFWFNTKMPGYKQDERTQTQREQPIGLVSDGYEASAHSLDYEAEKITKELRDETLKLSNGPNVPINFPAVSDAWMYYADHLANLTPRVLERTSDYIGFSLRAYEHHNPPQKSQRVGAGTPEGVYSTQFNHSDYSNVYSVLSAPSNPEPLKVDSERRAELATPMSTGNRPSVTIRIARSGDEITRQLVDGNNKVISESLEAFSKLCYPRDKPGYEKVQKGTLFDSSLLVMLQRVADKYPGKKIIIYSGIRMPKSWDTYNKKIKAGGRPNRHIEKRAIDFKVSGVDNRTLFRFIAKTFRSGGAGYYPNNHPSGGSHFVHMDSRPEYPMFLWVDESGKGKPSKYNKAHEVLSGIRNRRPVSDEDIKAEAEHLAQERLDRQEEETSRESLVPSHSDQSVDPTPVEDKLIIDKSRDFEARAKWIEDMAASPLNLSYYWDDPKIRNVFYRDIDFHIGSNPDEHKSGEVAPAIVFSAISVTFGHRIVPHKLASQDTYTWQFLGAGNRTGTMVFTFGDAQGRESADKLKALINTARENARKFGSMLQDAGSIGIYWNKVLTRERNTILALLDVNDIVITDITEAATDDGTDLHQLVINFIVQDFAEEEFDKNFVTETDTKRRVITRLMDLLWVHKLEDSIKLPGGNNLQTVADNERLRDWQKIYPHPKYLSVRSVYEPEVFQKEQAHFARYGNHMGGAGRPYKKNDDSFPSWLAEILITASEYCREADNAIAPTGWQISNQTGETWRDRYAFWGAGDKIKGRVKNIDRNEMNASMAIGHVDKYSESQDVRAVIQWDQMYKGNFQYDGGSQGTKTNENHARAFNKWLNKMSLLVEEVQKHITDEENFKEYFGGLGENMMGALVDYVGQCYKDMFLPTLPERDIPLPPEFYVYDDSGEDPSLSALTDDSNMARLLEKHIDNEIASIERYTKETALGGSYLSRNLPRIIEERKQYLDVFAGKDRNSGESAFMSFSQMMKEGTKAWQPIFYRPNDPAYNREETQRWASRVTGELGSDGDTKLGFMDNLIKLSPYLRDGHGASWQSGATLGAPDNYLVETLYDEDWRDLSFGPNPSYTHADSVMSGLPPNPTSKEAFNRAKERKVQAAAMEEGRGSEGGDIPGLRRSVTSDGAVTVGNNFQESFAEASAARDAVISDTVSSVWGFIKDAAATGAKYGAFGPAGLLYTSLTDVASFSDAYEKTQTRREIEEILSDYDHPIASAFEASGEKSKIAQLAAGIATGTKSKDLSIRRAFPTFKIYFIEDDSHETEQVDGKVLRAFDDFYSYSAVQEIRVTRSRKIAADLAIIRITNIGGKLLRKRFGDKPGWEAKEQAKSGQKAEYATGIFADTEKENPFERMILQDGVKVQIRLGYASNPDHLETVFLGSIVEIQPTEGGKILELVCQGFGAELEGVELGPLNDGPVFYSSQQVLSGSIIQDSIVNFGRRSKFNRFNPAEARHGSTGGVGRGLLASVSPGAILDVWSQQKLYRHLYRYSFRNYPQDDNIFAPPPDVYTNTWERFWDNACLYRPLKQTPWQIFKEHELRHPGYISMAVPYGHSPRMTMFFGAKGQHYWSKPPTALELFLAENASDAIVQMRGMSQADILDPQFTDKLVELGKKYPKLSRVIAKSITSFGAPTSAALEIGKIFGRYKPFRNYHYFDSTHHILKNEIRTSVDGTYNQVEVLYFEDEEEVEESSAIALQDNIKALQSGQEGVYSCKLDDNIPEEHIRSYREEFPSCVTDFMAKRYVQGLFARLLRDTYKGELCVTGEETLKPYDICYLNDTSINMSGPIEVERVEHIFNRDYGFISIITPDLCLDINDMYSASVFDVTGAALAYTFGLKDPDTALALSAMRSPLGFLAVTAGVKFMMWMQEGTPVISTPLTLEGKPFMSVSLGQKRASFFMCLHGQWKQYWDDLSVAWDKFDIAESLFDTHVSFQESLAGFFTSDPGLSIEEAR